VDSDVQPGANTVGLPSPNSLIDLSVYGHSQVDSDVQPGANTVGLPSPNSLVDLSILRPQPGGQ